MFVSLRIHIFLSKMTYNSSTYPLRRNRTITGTYSKSYILDVDLQYPKHLHDAHPVYALAAENY